MNDYDAETESRFVVSTMQDPLTSIPDRHTIELALRRAHGVGELSKTAELNKLIYAAGPCSGCVIQSGSDAFDEKKRCGRCSGCMLRKALP